MIISKAIDDVNISDYKQHFGPCGGKFGELLVSCNRISVEIFEIS